VGIANCTKRRKKRIWTIAEHGDGPEKAWYGDMRKLFPVYESVWANHVVPLTYRIKEPARLLLVRPGVPARLRRFAKAHYGVYFRLARARREEADQSALRSLLGLEPFYINLHAAVGLIAPLLITLNEVLLHYRPGWKSCRKVEKWAELWSTPDLLREWRVLTKQIGIYRDVAAHSTPMVTFDGLVPNPEALLRVRGDGREDRARDWNPFQDLAQLAKLQADPNAQSDYKDVSILAREHMERSLRLCNSIWEKVEHELAPLLSDPTYEADQRKWNSPDDDKYYAACLAAQETSKHDVEGFQGRWARPR
jgi:hypothetical protein